MKRIPLFCLPLLVALGGCSMLQADDPEAIARRDVSAEQLYQEAKTAARQGNYETAVERLEMLQTRYPFDDYTRQAQVDIIYMHYEADDMAAAISAADRFIHLYPTHPRVDYAYFMRAQANQQSGKDLFAKFFPTDRARRDPLPLRQAFADLKTLVTRYPDSAYTKEAQRQMLKLRDQLARHELQVAEFYLGREAYVAAANRAKSVIETYQGTSAVQDALEILVTVYDRLELGGLRDDVLKVIRLNYPDHPLAQQAG